jgi:hypothetical protein
MTVRSLLRDRDEARNNQHRQQEKARSSHALQTTREIVPERRKRHAAQSGVPFSVANEEV